MMNNMGTTLKYITNELNYIKMCQSDDTIKKRIETIWDDGFREGMLFNE